MISAVNAVGCGGLGIPRAPSYTGMGHQALLPGFMEEFRKAQAKACKQDVEELKRAGLSDKLAGKEDTRQDEDEKFTF